jgi:hypothetical protein
MSEVTSQAAALELIERIEVWRDFAFGHKDLWPTPASLGQNGEPLGNDLLHRLYEVYCVHLSAAVSEHVWARFLGVLATLLSTRHLSRQWDAMETEFPADFRALMHSIRGQ